jgi:hypothetical protein
LEFMGCEQPFVANARYRSVSFGQRGGQKPKGRIAVRFRQRGPAEPLYAIDGQRREDRRLITIRAAERGSAWVEDHNQKRGSPSSEPGIPDCTQISGGRLRGGIKNGDFEAV